VLPFHRILDALGRRLGHGRVLTSARRKSLEHISRSSGGRLLVLCHGNIYRSPFVERRLAALLPPDRWTLRSAGFHDRTQRVCAPEFVTLARQYGVSLADHRSSRVTEQDLRNASLVVIMDRKNWDQLQTLAAEAERKVVWIGCALPRGSVEVEDPYGRSGAEMRRIVDRLNQAAEALACRLG